MKPELQQAANRLVETGRAANFYEACSLLARRGAAQRRWKARQRRRQTAPEPRQYWWQDQD